MDRPRNYHTKWSELDRQRQISYDITNMWNLKKTDTNELVYKTIDSQTWRTNIGGSRSGGAWGKGYLGSLDWHVHTVEFKMDNQQGPTG